ncbi:uncharacterized protein LOC105686799 [Athalia rosae]|uniref:uncharacterized protein LOC105686799 n=1 Tax=Athalia rosae TaxID=37344 RepID=UPI002033C203|nr:uncharacterized protein LOC105686799 [Athalia rosae]
MWYSTLEILLVASCVFDYTAQAHWHNGRNGPFYGVRITAPSNVWSDHLQEQYNQHMQALQKHNTELFDRLTNRMGTRTSSQQPCTPGNSESRLDKIENSLSRIEQLISQSNENLATVLEKRLEARLDRIVEEIGEVSNHLKKTSSPTVSTPAISETEFSLKLNAIEDRLKEQVGRIELKVDAMALMNVQEASSQTEKLKSVSTTVKDVSDRLEDVEDSLKKLHLTAENSTACSEAISQGQQSTLGDVREVTTSVENLVRNISTLYDDKILHNQTLAVLREAHNALEVKVKLTISGMMSQVTANEKEMKKSVEALRSDLASKTDCDNVNRELRKISDTQVATVSAIANVLNATDKIGVEVQQRFVEFGETIDNQTANAGLTFDRIAGEIMSNHNQALANSENVTLHELQKAMSPMIAIQQKITSTAGTLDELHDQSGVCINGVTSALRAITSQENARKEREREIDSNLSSMLESVAVVTQEFDHIKTGLDAAMESIKASLEEMQKKTNELLSDPVKCEAQPDRIHIADIHAV